MEVKILFRRGLGEENEYEIAKKYFNVITSRCDIKPNDLVIGRYSVLPYYKELQNDIIKMGGTLINSYSQHRYVADLKNYYYDLESITPKTWENFSDISKNHPGPFVLKGETNSKKLLFKTHMFAENRNEIMKVYSRLLDDSFISDQKIYIREFVNLKNYGKCEITGVPIAKEFRIFVLNGKIVGRGFYWANFYEDIKEQIVDDIPEDFLNKVVDIVSPNINFFVIDVAQKEDGEWIVIELNDGCMSGLSCIEPENLYAEMKKTL